MNKIFILTTLVFFKITFISAVQVHWQKITIGSNGYVFYINLLNIKEIQNKVYFWQLIDYLRPDEYGDMSAKIYIESDCINLKYKWLSFSYHKESMAKDIAIQNKPSKNLSHWQTASPSSTSASVLEYVCNSLGVVL